MKNKLFELAKEETVSNCSSRVCSKRCTDADAFCKTKEHPTQLEMAKIMRAIIGLLGFFGIKATEEQYRVCFDAIRKSNTERYITFRLFGFEGYQ